MDVKRNMMGGLTWINFTQVRIHWQRLLKTVMELLGVSVIAT